MKRKHYRALVKAVNVAAQWRGSLTGNYGDEESMREEDERLADFDAHIKLCREALKEIRDGQFRVDGDTEAGKGREASNCKG